MKRPLLLLLSAALLASCSSSSSPRAEIIRPEIQLQQLTGPQDLGIANTITDFEFAVQVANRSAEPITLKRIQMASVGTGAYTLRREYHNFNETIAPDGFSSVKFFNRAYVYGSSTFSPSNEPVLIRAIAYFDSPVGSFTQIVQQQLMQFPGAR